MKTEFEMLDRQPVHRRSDTRRDPERVPHKLRMNDLSNCNKPK